MSQPYLKPPRGGFSEGLPGHHSRGSMHGEHGARYGEWLRAYHPTFVNGTTEAARLVVWNDQKVYDQFLTWLVKSTGLIVTCYDVVDGYFRVDTGDLTRAENGARCTELQGYLAEVGLCLVDPDIHHDSVGGTLALLRGSHG